MPSTVSRSVSRPLASSTVITPSLPTFSMAAAIRSPISLSLLAEMLPTWAISFLPPVGTLIFLSSSTTAATARSIPRLMAIGLAPAVTFLRPSRKIAWARTVAVVVPSPARSLVLVATSLTICAPMFSRASESSISLATVTPSLVTVGAPNFLSMTTFRPFGPSVTFTASASWSTPRLRAARASPVNWRVLAAMGSGSLYRDGAWASVVRSGAPLGAGWRGRPHRSAQDGEDVGLAEDEKRLAVYDDFGAAVFPKEDSVADLDVHRDALAVVEAARADGEDLALLRLLLGGVRDEQSPTGQSCFFERPHQDAIGERTDLDRR